MKSKRHTRSPSPLKDDLFGGDHGEPATDVLVDGVAELGPRAALDGALAEAGIGEFPDSRGGDDLDLVAIVVELVLNHLLDPVIVGSDHLARRQEEGQVLSVVLLELSPPELSRLGRVLGQRCHGCGGGGCAFVGEYGGERDSFRC